MSAIPPFDFSFTKSLLVFIGAGAGGLLRYWLGSLIQAWWRPSFPLGTLVVNVSGCLAMGFLAAAWSGAELVRDETRVIILVGLIGGYTTFSSFGLETFALAKHGDWMRAGLYVFSSVGLSLLGVWIGVVLADRSP